MKHTPHILLAGGGTGGHVYPAIAIADAVREIAPAAEIAFAGTRDRMEWSAVPKAGYTIYPITVSGLQRRLTAQNLTFPFKLMKGFAESWALIGAFDPDVAVGTGGYVSGPVLLAATLRGRPIVLQEQNAYAGLTNRLLARRAAEIHVAFEEAKAYVPAERCVLSGNPTRAALQAATRAEMRAEGRRHFEIPEDATVLAVFGGSLGSKALNDAVEQHRAALLASETVHILWQTGTRYIDALRPRLEGHPRLHVRPYVDRMDLAYAAADLTLCRAGALTCSELMVTKTPAVLVPSPNVTADHQTKNARSMAEQGAAALLLEPALQTHLLPTVQPLLQDATRRAAMAEAAGRLARPHAARRIARHVLRLAGWKESEQQTANSE